MQFDVTVVERFQLNCSILWCERTLRAAVVDPGGNHDEILNILELMGLVPELVLVTHGHFDHAGGAAQFASRTGARIEGPHRGDANTIRAIPEAAAARGVKAQSYEPSRWLEDSDQVCFGAEVLEVLHCPGHCGGHVAYFHRERRQAFVGDILFRGAIGTWEHHDGNLAQLLDSIRHRLFPLGDDVGFVPGHGTCSTFGRERHDNPMVGDAAWARWQQRRTATG